jgi:hypothetical protein
MGLLRLATNSALVRHMGNIPPALELRPALASQRKPFLRHIIYLPGIRHFLLWLHNQIFRLYFFNVD